MGRWVFLFVWPALFSTAVAQCSLADLTCCLTEFTSFVSPAGISLSEYNLARSCTVKDETVECMEMFLQQCMQNQTDADAIKNLVNKTSSYIADICPPTSNFSKKLQSYQVCILNASTSFQMCYNRTELPDADKSKDALTTECCEYKALRNCATQKVEDKCEAAASQLVHEEVVNFNGAVLEWACKDTFSKCENSAVMLASSAFFVLWKIALSKFLL